MDNKPEFGREVNDNLNHVLRDLELNRGWMHMGGARACTARCLRVRNRRGFRVYNGIHKKQRYSGRPNAEMLSEG